MAAIDRVSDYQGGGGGGFQCTCRSCMTTPYDRRVEKEFKVGQTHL